MYRHLRTKITVLSLIGLVLLASPLLSLYSWWTQPFPRQYRKTEKYLTRIQGVGTTTVRLPKDYEHLSVDRLVYVTATNERRVFLFPTSSSNSYLFGGYLYVEGKQIARDERPDLLTPRDKRPSLVFHAEDG